jgi:hypothetical protein
MIVSALVGLLGLLLSAITASAAAMAVLRRLLPGGASSAG